MKKMIRMVGIATAMMLAVGSAQAADLTWNTTTGTWDTTTANWTGDATIFTDGGVDNVYFSNTAGGTITITADMTPLSTTVNAASGTYTFSGGPIDGVGTLTKSGAGALTLSSANSFSGGTTLNAGTLTLSNAGALGSGTLTINGGGISVTDRTLSGDIPIVMNGDWSVRTSHSGAWLRTGNGGITLNAPITINVTNSQLELGGSITSPGSTYNALDIGFIRSDTQNTGATFKSAIVLRGNQLANPVPSGTFVSITYSAAISDGGNGYGMTFSSPTGYNLNGGATFTGPITINSGSSVRIAPGKSVASTSITINTGGTLTLGDQNLGSSAATIPTGATLTNNGTFRLGDNTAYTQGTHFPNGISGTGSVEVRGTRATGVTFSGTNTYSGGTTVIYTGGGGPVVFNINSANAIGTGPLTLSQSGSNYATINNTSGGAVTLATNNAQNWNGPITFTGTNDLNLGTGTVTLANNPTISTTAGILTVGGTVNGSGQTLSKSGAGTLELNGATTLKKLSISGGTLSVSNGGTLTITDAAAIVGSGTSTLNLSGGAKLIAGAASTDWINGLTTATIGTGGAKIDTNGNDIGISQAFSGTGGLIKEGVGKLTISSAQTYAGTTTISAGLLVLDSTGFDSTLAGDVSVGANGTLDGDGVIGGNLFFASGGSLVFDTLNPLTVNGSVTFGGFSVANLSGLNASSVDIGQTYTLLYGDDVDLTNVANTSVATAYDLGDGKSAYFQSGSLQLVVIPEPATFGVVLGVLAAAILRRRRML